MAFIDLFGLEKDEQTGKTPLEWDPTTISRELMDRTGGKATPPGVLDRLMAGICVISTDRYFTRLKDFITLTNVLAGSELEQEMFDPADEAECLWGITESRLLSGEEKFNQDIITYVAKVYQDAGVKPPEPILDLVVAGGWVAPENAYSDNLELAGGIQDVAAQKYNDLVGWYRQRLALCRSQLMSLRLHNGQSARAALDPILSF